MNQRNFERLRFPVEPTVQVIRVEERACGKFIIIGEHAVVYGARAVAMPLSDYSMKISLKSFSPNGTTPAQLARKICMTSEGKTLPSHVCGVIDDAFKVLNTPPIELTIDIKPALPIGAGFGSSATLCVGVLRAISKAVGIELTVDDLARLATRLEERFHGNPSGLDTTVVAYEKVICFAKGQEPKEVSVSSQQKWNFALIDTRTRASTKAMIKIAEPYFRSGNGAQRIARFDELGEQVIQALGTADIPLAASAMNTAAKMLDEAGVVTEDLHKIMKLCLESGALAAKPTGAGGGGVVLALLDATTHKQDIENLRNNLSGYQVFDVNL